MHDRVRALCRRPCPAHGKTNKDSEVRAVPLAKPGGDETRVQAVRRDARARKAACELTCEQYPPGVGRLAELSGL